MKKVQEGIKKAGKWLSKGYHKQQVYMVHIMLSIVTVPMRVFAGNEGGGGGEADSWNTAMEYILTWVPRLGALILFGGVIEYAIAYQSDNAQMKTQATRLMVAGGMVMGVSTAISSLILI